MAEIVDDPTMVERVARAIWMENQPAGAPAYENLDFLDQGRVKMIARACIKVMRIPTDEMIHAAFDGTSFSFARQPEIKAAWEAMIDEALKED